MGTGLRRSLAPAAIPEAKGVNLHLWESAHSAAPRACRSGCQRAPPRHPVTTEGHSIGRHPDRLAPAPRLMSARSWDPVVTIAQTQQDGTSRWWRTRRLAALSIPTVGIGAGPGCDAQILVWQDMVGLTAGRLPRFVKRYGDMRNGLLTAARQYVSEVAAGSYPGHAHSYA